MTHKPRLWPNVAKEARDVSAEQAVKSLRALEPLLEQSFSKEETIRRIAIAIDASHRIVYLLKAQGAPIELRQP